MRWLTLLFGKPLATRLRHILRDRRGAITVEYSIVLAMAILIAFALSGFARVLYLSYEAAPAVLQSGSP